MSILCPILGSDHTPKWVAEAVRVLRGRFDFEGGQNRREVILVVGVASSAIRGPGLEEFPIRIGFRVIITRSEEFRPC